MKRSMLSHTQVKFQNCFGKRSLNSFQTDRQKLGVVVDSTVVEWRSGLHGLMHVNADPVWEGSGGVCLMEEVCCH